MDWIGLANDREIGRLVSPLIVAQINRIARRRGWQET